MIPRIAIAGGNIYDVAVLTNGSYAALTGQSIELFDSALAHRATIAGTTDGERLVVLDDDRFLAYRRFGGPTVGQVGGAVTPFSLGELGSPGSYIATAGGFIVVAFKGMLVDRGGTRTVVMCERRVEHGGCAWRGGAAIAGFDGLAIVDADGRELARSTDVSVDKQPVALANAIVVSGYREVFVFDGAAQVLSTIPVGVSSADAIVPFRDGLLLRTHDDDRGEATVGYWHVDGTEQWSVTVRGTVDTPVVAGDRVVVPAYKGNTWILDGDGTELACIPTASYVDAIAAFGDGIAISVRDSFAVRWWRPGAPIVELAHDAAPSILRTLPNGRLLSTDGKALCLWSPHADEQGVEPAAVASQLPMNTPIVVHGSIVEVVGAGRFALRARRMGGGAQTLEPDVAWRPLTTRDEAARILKGLVQPAFTGAAADVSGLAQLPLAETADLQARALFAASTLEPALRDRVVQARSSFFDELGAALGRSGRELLAAVKARKLELVPPKPVPKPYEYLGTFTTSGDLIVSDPCYIGKKTNPAMGFSLSHKLAGHDGIWHVFVRDDDGRTGELVAIHDTGFGVYASEGVALIGVDSGTAGVFDKKCPKRDADTHFEEGPFAALGAIAWSGYGDGMYPVFTGSVNGRVAKIRIHFLGDDPEIDRTLAKPTTTAKPYSPKTTFAIGDAIAHPTFGTGSVVKVGGDGKIDVRFPDVTRTLVHAKK